MSTILVVDDSPVDRRVAGGLLQANQYFQLEFAEDGNEALEKISQAMPDLVLTDLMMPGMDGFELVAAIRHRFPQLPVILMTAKGSEETAIRALKEGASSYVPKQQFNTDLLSTVEAVLAISRRQRGEERLLGSMNHIECQFTLGIDVSLFPPLVSYLQEQMQHLELCDEAERIRVGVALEEALVNALYHGNLEVSSDIYEKDYAAYKKLVDQRFAAAPYNQRQIYVQADMSRAGATFVIRDEGAGFAPDSLPDPTVAANLGKSRGRGVLLMRTFMDDVAFNDIGNEVTMTKRSEVVMEGN